MTGYGKSGTDLPLEASIPIGAAPLESILCTEELHRRPSRLPDYEKENRALGELMSALSDSTSTIFQTLAETILDITQCDSAGLSLLTTDGTTPDVCGKRFYWPAIAGMWNPHVGGVTPRNFSPCGDVLDQNRTLLFRHFERRYSYLLPVIPAAEECLLAPFYVAGDAVGAIWAIMHSDRRKFDAEDDRVMASLGKFASSAYQALAHLEDLRFQVTERERAEAEVRELAKGLEAKLRRLFEANVVGIVMWNLEGAITGANDAFLRMVQYDHEDLASGRVRWTDLTPAEWRGHNETAIADLTATGIFQPFEREYLRKDGSRVPVLLGGALFEGSANEGVAFVLDLSEQKQRESARLYSEERYRVLVEAMSDAVVSIDDKGSIEFANSAIATIFGYEPGELAGKPSTLLMPESMRQLHQSGIERYLATGQRRFNWQGMELTALRKNGEEFPVEISFGEVTRDGHKTFTGVLRDISKRKEAEQAQRRSEALIAEAQQRQHALQKAFLQQLIASQESERQRIAAELHDCLGQRLVVINNLALFSMRTYEKAGAMEDVSALKEISEETSQAIQETREISYNLRPFQLDRLGLTKAIQGILRTVTSASRLRITSELDNIDDAFSEELRINFYRIVQEALNNIMKHAQATEVLVRIVRTVERLTLTIRDNGVGFTPGDRPSKGGKSGFGLTGMEERTHLLGGELRVASALGTGTVLTMEIPIGIKADA